MTETGGFVTVTALILLLVLSCFALSLSRQARFELEIAGSQRRYEQDLALAEAVALSVAAEIVQKKDENFLKDKCLWREAKPKKKDFLQLPLAKWQQNDIGISPDAFVVCRLEKQVVSESLDVDAGQVLEMQLFVRVKKNPYAPIICLGVRKFVTP